MRERVSSALLDCRSLDGILSFLHWALISAVSVLFLTFRLTSVCKKLFLQVARLATEAHEWCWREGFTALELSLQLRTQRFLSFLSAWEGAHIVLHFWITGPLVVFAGIKDLKLMKTTQSGFEGFYKNEHTTLPERNDRILCGELFCKWSYGECRDFDFDCIWYTSNQIIFIT